MSHPGRSPEEEEEGAQSDDHQEDEHQEHIGWKTQTDGTLFISISPPPSPPGAVVYHREAVKNEWNIKQSRAHPRTEDPTPRLASEQRFPLVVQRRKNTLNVTRLKLKR